MKLLSSDRGPYSNYTYGLVHKVEQKFNSLFDLIYKDARWTNISIFIDTPAELANKRRIARSPENSSLEEESTELRRMD